MPSVPVYIPLRHAKPELVAALDAVIRMTVAKQRDNHPTVVITEADVWPHIVGTLNDGHVTVVWFVHDIPEKNRTEAWVTEVSQDLSERIRHACLAFGLDSKLQVCTDGDLRHPKNMTGFAGPT
ncbi:MAG: hypothetical protein HY457_03700 [Parcubacteria group bacterium]|nr:hypothetical protein [Parcubacteria group bacterium]